jgi:hypothetical protein
VSKGSTPRPYSVNLKTFDNNWDNIFRKNQVDDGKQPAPGTSRIDSSNVELDIDTDIKDSTQGG